MEDNKELAGLHIILDAWGARYLTDLDQLSHEMITAAELAGATVLDANFHTFTGGGITGVAILAESHISVHTWPEHQYAAFDVFMCGKCKPQKAIDYLVEALAPSRFTTRTLERGIGLIP